MTKFNKKMVCFLLVMAMILSALSLPAFAADADSSDPFFIEAEKGTINRKSNLTKVKDKTASGGYYIVSEGGSEKLEDPDSMDPELKITYNAPKDATYYVWMRYMAESKGCDSFFIGFNDAQINSQYGTALDVTEEYWGWKMVLSGELKQGKNTLKLYHRENMARYDAFYITSDKSFVPAELAELKAEQERLEAERRASRVVEPIGTKNTFNKYELAAFEAESSASKDISTEKDKTASGEKYLILTSTSKSRVDDPALYGTPAATYTIETPKETTYYVWARTKADNGGTDTAWICFDNGDFTQINSIVGEEWSWVKVLTGKLDAGVHTVNLVPREAGTHFDKFIITSDVAYMPSGLGDIDSEPTYESVYPMPSVLPPANQHPRVYFTKDDIPRIKENFTKEQNKASYELFRKVADNTASDGTATKGQFDAKVVGKIEAKAFDYAINGNEEHGREAISMLKNMLTTLDMSLSAFDYNEAGETEYIIGAVYDWCYDLLDADSMKLFQNMVVAVGQHLETSYPPIKQGAVTGHGTEGQIYRDLLAVGIAMYDERPDIYGNAAGRIFKEMIEPRKFFYQSHMHPQGSHYSAYRFQHEILCTYLFDAIGYPNVFGEEQQYCMYEYLYTRRPDGMVFFDGDSSQNNKAYGSYDTSHMRSMFLAGNYFKDPYLKYEAERQMKNYVGSELSGRGNQNTSPVEFLICNDPDFEGKPFTSLPLSTYKPYPKSGMTARTGWNDGIDSPDVVVDMKINNVWTANHQHLDAGAFQIYYKGYLATDDGYYQGYRSGVGATTNDGNTDYGAAHWYNYYRRTIAHNAMLVYDPDEDTKNFLGYANDGGQKTAGGEVTVLDQLLDESKGYVIGETLGHDIGIDQYAPNYTYLKGDIAKAYSDKVENYERSFMFLNLKNDEHPAALLVFDRVISSNPSFKKTWLCHGLYEPAISGNRTVFENTAEWKDGASYNGRLTIDTLLPKNADISTIGGEGHEHEVNGVNWIGKPAGAGSVNEGQGWRVEISPSEKNKQDYFLNVLQMSDADGEDALPVTLIETDTHAGAVVADRVVVFGKDRDRTKNDVVFTVENDGEFEFTVADLEAGTWSVTKDGSYICDTVATADGGVGVFNGGKGEYILSYKNGNSDRQTYSSDAPYDEGIQLRVGGRFIYSDVKPTIIDDRTLVPMRAIFEKLGVDVSWDEATSTATALREGDGREVKITQDSKTAYIDGEAVELDVPAMILNDRFVVPVRFVSESFGATVGWQAAGQIVDVSAPIFTAPVKIPTAADGYIAAKSITVSATYEGATGYETVDGNVDTLWSYEGTGEGVTYDFGSTQTFSAVEIIWNKGDQRKQYFQVFVSDDNTNWTEVIHDGVASGKAALTWESYALPAGTKGRYVKVICNGTSAGTWQGIIEIGFKK